MTNDSELATFRNLPALVLVFGAGGGSGQIDPPYPDPFPPYVQELDSVVIPDAMPFEGLRTHRPPRPLPDGAVFENASGFLGVGRDGHSREAPLDLLFGPEGPPLVWDMDCGSGFASPVIEGDRLVFTHRVGNEVFVDCLDATTGQRYWRFAHPCDYEPRYIEDSGPRSTPVIAGEHVYVHGVQGSLHCLELATGRIVWKRELSREFEIPDHFFGVVSSPLVYVDLLIQILGAPGGPCVVAFDRHSGRIVWTAGKQWGPDCSSPVIAYPFGRDQPPKLFVLTGGETRPPTGGLMMIDPTTGKVDFEHPFRSRVAESVNGATPVVPEGKGMVFLSAAYGVGSARIDVQPSGTFQVVWTNRRLGLEFSTPVYENGVLYAIDGVNGRSGAFVAIDPATGKELRRMDIEWTETVDVGDEKREVAVSIGAGSLLFADGKFLCLGDRGALVVLEPTPGGEEAARVVSRASLFHSSECWTPPVLSHGLLYVRQNAPGRFGASGRRLLCYDVRGG